mmetsp:Transcript_16238/g.40402  ORF Transcript_16238/g.40402 Transcript_16238/m.40402 type:complete len:90 (-) Transcript_16238:106-375(-)
MSRASPRTTAAPATPAATRRSGLTAAPGCMTAASQHLQPRQLNARVPLPAALPVIAPAFPRGTAPPAPNNQPANTAALQEAVPGRHSPA